MLATWFQKTFSFGGKCSFNQRRPISAFLRIGDVTSSFPRVFQGPTHKWLSNHSKTSNEVIISITVNLSLSQWDNRVFFIFKCWFGVKAPDRYMPWISIISPIYVFTSRRKGFLDERPFQDRHSTSDNFKCCLNTNCPSPWCQKGWEDGKANGHHQANSPHGWVTTSPHPTPKGTLSCSGWLQCRPPVQNSGLRREKGPRWWSSPGFWPVHLDNEHLTIFHTLNNERGPKAAFHFHHSFRMASRATIETRPFQHKIQRH